jgi:hypothetical protein
MKILHSVKRFLDGDDGTSRIEGVVMVFAIVMLCLTIQMHAHRHPQTAGAPAPVRSAFHFS